MEPGHGASVQKVMAKRSIAIVGAGNEFRGDDRVGIAILRELKGLLPAEVKTMELTGDQSTLLELMQEATSLIIVDAVCSSAPAGTIFQINATEEPFPESFFSVSTHGIDLARSIELARAMKQMPELVLIYGIVGKDFSFSTSMSRQVEDSAEVVKERILTEVTTLIGSEA